MDEFPISPSFPNLEITSLLSASLSVTLLETSYKWNYAECVLWLAYFT